MRLFITGLMTLALVPGEAWATSAKTVIATTSNTTAYQQQSNATQESTAQNNNVSQNAEAGRSSQSAAAAMNMMMAAALTAACLAPCPKCQMALCAMGALAAMQGMHDSGAAGKSSTTYDAGTDTGTVTPVGDDPLAKGETAKTSAILAQGQAKLTEQGMKVTAAGVTNPDGSVTPASAFSSPSAMAAAGMDPGAISDAQKIIADVSATAPGAGGYKVASVAVDGGGGTGASSAVPDEGGGNNSALMGEADRKKLLAGKTVLFDGEPIGVRGDNIFDMIHVCYGKKRDNRNFIETEAGPRPASLRQPASLPK